jgi:hypothetical protein
VSLAVEASPMVKRPMPDISVLGVQERVLLFCVGSGTDWRRAGVTSETMTGLMVRGLLVRDALGQFQLTDNGRTALRALLPGQ